MPYNSPHSLPPGPDTEVDTVALSPPRLDHRLRQDPRLGEVVLCPPDAEDLASGQILLVIRGELLRLKQGKYFAENAEGVLNNQSLLILFY